MNKTKKILLISFSAVIGFLLLLYLLLGCFMKKPGMNGFTVTNGMIRLLLTDRDYVQVGENRYLFQKGCLSTLIETEYDSVRFKEEYEGLSEMDENSLFKAAIVSKDGREYDLKGVKVWDGKARSAYFKPFSELFTREYEMLNSSSGYRYNDGVWEITVDGEKSYRPILSDSEIRTKALEEAKKEKYKGIYHENAVYTDISSITIRIGDAEFGWGYHDVPNHITERTSCIYTVRIMDINDPLNSVILYYDAYTGALLEWESLSD